MDLRLAELWRELFEIPQERWDVDLIGWFLRTAYGQGYCDALQEGERGALCREVAEAIAAVPRTSPSAWTGRGAAREHINPLASPFRVRAAGYAEVVTPESTPAPMTRGRRHIRLVFALVIASLLGTFAVYTALVSDTTPLIGVAEAASGQKAGEDVKLTGKVVSFSGDASTDAGMKITLADYAGGADDPGRLPRQRARRLQGGTGDRPRRHGGGRGVPRQGGLARDEVPVEVHAGRRRLGPVLMATLGRGALILALLLGIYAMVAAVLGARSRDRRLILSSRRAVYALVAAVLAADAVFMGAIVTHDFSFVTVAETSSRKLPTAYLVTSFWASQPGSLLLWLTVLVCFTGAVLCRTSARTRELMPWVTAILAGTCGFFASMLVFAASPFVTQIAPADGRGLNPSLQNPYMVAHPPSLYLGYVGLAIPFAFCMAALLARQKRRALDRRRRGAGRWPRGRSSASACCSAPTGRTSRSAGAGSGPGTRSRTPR